MEEKFQKALIQYEEEGKFDEIYELKSTYSNTPPEVCK
jgi:hypothetical protein